MYITIDVYFLLVKFTNCFVQRSLEFFPCVANGFQPQDLVKSSYADVLAWGVDKLTALSLCRWGLFFFFGCGFMLDEFGAKETGKFMGS